MKAPTNARHVACTAARGKASTVAARLLLPCGRVRMCLRRGKVRVRGRRMFTLRGVSREEFRSSQYNRPHRSCSTLPTGCSRQTCVTYCSSRQRLRCGPTLSRFAGCFPAMGTAVRVFHDDKRAALFRAWLFAFLYFESFFCVHSAVLKASLCLCHAELFSIRLRRFGFWCPCLRVMRNCFIRLRCADSPSAHR